MDTPGNKPSEQPKVNKALPKNPFVALETMPEAQRLAFFATPEGKAVQFSDERIREELQDPSRKDRETGRALSFPLTMSVVQGFMRNLANHYDYLFALDEHFAPFHLMRLVCNGTRDEALHDGWAKSLNMLDYLQMAATQLGLSLSDVPSSQALTVSPPTILPGEDVRRKVEELLAGREMSPETRASFEQSLRAQQQKPLNPVQLNQPLLSLFETKKIDTVEQFPHPVLAEIWAYPEFQDLYRRVVNAVSSGLRVFTEERLKMKTPERVFEASFVLQGSIADHLEVVLQLARTIRPSFMTAPDLAGLPNGQRLLVMATSDQRFQSPAELTTEIRTVAQKNGVSLGDIECRWNQEKETNS